MKQLFFFFFVSLSIFTCYPEDTIHIIINVKSANYRKPQKKKKMAGSIILHDPGGCCALAKKKWNGVQKRERRATVSGPRAHSQWPGTRDRTETALPQQTKATCSKQPSLLGSKSKVQTSDRTEKFSVACVSRYKYSMSNTYDFSQSTDLSCIFVFNVKIFPLHFLSSAFSFLLYLSWLFTLSLLFRTSSLSTSATFRKEIK